MINEDRVKHMTRMAIFEKNYSHEYEPMLRYKKKEYVALHGWAGFFGGTLLYLVIFALVMLEFISSLGDEFKLSEVALFIAIGMLIYAAYIVLHVHFTRTKAKNMYKEGSRLIKERKLQYDKLLSMYEDEAQATRPTRIPARYTRLEEQDME